MCTATVDLIPFSALNIIKIKIVIISQLKIGSESGQVTYFLLNSETHKK